MYGRGAVNMCWVAVAWGTCARLVKLHCLVWFSASGRARVSMWERAKTPSELLVPFMLARQRNAF